jgi:predicted Fe-Mo cluster-binding NifX family protein
MRIAVSADDASGLSSIVSPHFGRCPYYILVDLEGQEVQQVTAVPNPYYEQHQPGQVPGFIRSQGADVMITGGMGRRALGLFEQYRVEAVTGAYGTVQRALEGYLGGELHGAEACGKSTARSHEQEPAAERLTEGEAADEYEQGEVGRLREEAEMLQRQLAEVMERLERLAGD